MSKSILTRHNFEQVSKTSLDTLSVKSFEDWSQFVQIKNMELNF